MRRRRRPGVTAAATTAVLATGARPGVTALVTTAALATGARMTPTLPTRSRLRGISISCGRYCLVSLDRRNDGLNRNPSVGDQLTPRAPRCCCERRRPQVLPDENSGDGSRVHRGGKVLDVLLGQQLRQLGLAGLELSELA